MGLDMYLRGRKFVGWSPETTRHEDGFAINNVELELGYWRKHPNLHGFIVQTFAKGVDECQEIDLSSDDLDTIIAAVKAKMLPATTGFFFGRSDGSEHDDDIKILEAAKTWLNTPEESGMRAVHYRASW